MEAATLVQSSFSLCKRSGSTGGFRSSNFLPNPVHCVSNGILNKRYHSMISHSTSGQRGNKALSKRRSAIVKASMTPQSNDSNNAPSHVAPLKLESKIGQFLSEYLVNHPHLLPAAIEFQLEQLKADRTTEEQKDQPSVDAATGTDLILYRRIAEVKANERKQALEEILYALTVQKFVDANVSLTPTIAADSSSGTVETYPEQNSRIEQLHSAEALEMIHNHLALIMGARVNDDNSFSEISKLKIGQVYAASVMYGYFLKRVDQRFQLEKAVKFLPQASEEVVSDVQQSMGLEAGQYYTEASQTMGSHPEADAPSPGGFGYGMKPSRLRTYVMSFDAETLQKYATIRSKEAVTIIEKHTEALFGKPEIVINPDGTIDSSKDPKVRISFGGLKRLVLEAVTFGSYLWDVESYVDSRYHFVAS